MKTKKEKSADASSDLRECISRFLIFSIVGGTVVIGILIIIYELFIKKTNDMTFVGQTLLPLWGTWVGTVLAFYFGKSNFEAATKSYRDVIKSLTPEEKMASIKVTDVMIPLSKISYLDYEDSQNKTLVDIINDEKFKEYNRFAFINDNNILEYIIHRSEFTKYMTEKALAGDNIKEITFAKFLQDSANNKNNYVLKNSAFVSVNSTLLDAKTAMDSIKECEDVFVTQTGKDSEPVLGLITNNLIFEKAKV
jgi:hypothetical protein